MALALSDNWVWDFWFAQDGEDVHIFYLQAPKSLGDPELRHRNATIGHAVSHDLATWEILPDALGPSPTPAFDDLATWTGSVIYAKGLWHMFYTGISTAEEGAVQRIGTATSTDLVTWTKNTHVLEADPRWYEKLHPDVHEEAWRDPWVWWDEQTRLFHMFITARANHGPLDARGVIGHASSPDLVTWRTHPPLSTPGDFYHLEVPQLVQTGPATWAVLFCVSPTDHAVSSGHRAVHTPQGGTHFYTANHPLGPFTLADGPFLYGNERATNYAGRILHHHGTPLLFTWLSQHDDGEFGGIINSPVRVAYCPDGRIIVPPAEHGMD